MYAHQKCITGKSIVIEQTKNLYRKTVLWEDVVVDGTGEYCPP